MKLEGARVLITGGSRGLGKATATMLKEAGADILITARDESTLREVATKHGFHALCADVANEDDIARTFQNLPASWNGGLDVLINNAGIGSFPTLEDLDLEDFRHVFEVNVFGLALMTKHAVALMKKEGKGHIVNIASSAGVKGFARGTVYSSSKFAVRSMTQCWQAELRPHNIRVILINPSEVPTAFNQENRVERPLQEGKLTPEEIAHLIKGALEMDDRGFIPELSVWATNPWQQ